jgi:hypothetical protein
MSTLAAELLMSAPVGEVGQTSKHACVALRGLSDKQYEDSDAAAVVL